MSANGKIKTRCPVCEARYHVPPGAVGHRAHCNRCDTTFRVIELIPPEQKNHYIPTEDDILGWLNGGQDESDMPVRPRIVDGATAKPAAAIDNQAEEERSSDVPSKPLSSPLSDRLQSLETKIPAKVMSFRKTG